MTDSTPAQAMTNSTPASEPAASPEALRKTLDQLLADIERASKATASSSINSRLADAQAVLMLAQAYASLVAPDAPHVLLSDSSTSTTQSGLLNFG